MAGRIRHRDAPGESGAADREILEAALHEADHLVAPGRRQDEVGVRVIEGEQAVAPFRQLEEVGLLLHPLALGTGRRDLRPLRAVGELALGVVGLVARSEEHTSELQSLMRISYAVFCLKKK